MRRAFLALGALSVVLFPHAPAAATGPDWRDWDRGLAEARAAGRPLLVDVYTDWCGWCKRMDREVYAHPEVRDYLALKFVTVKLDAEGSQTLSYDGRTWTARTLARRLGVTGYPTTLFLDPKGGPPEGVPGYLPPDRFLLLLRYFGDGHAARGVPFADFARGAQGPGTGRARARR